jgi:signal transduction histidine kinase
MKLSSANSWWLADTPAMQNQSRVLSLRWLGAIVLLALLYYAGARLGLPFSFGKTNATPIWPPAGFAVAALLLLGRNAWPGVWLGAFAANASVFSANHVAPPSTVWWLSAIIATGNTLEAMAGWYIIVRWLARSESVIPSLTERMLLGRLGAFSFAFAALAAALVAAFIGPLAVCMAGVGDWKDYPLVLFTWWAGDATSILLLTPFLIALAAPRPSLERDRWFWVELVGAFSFLILTEWSIFDEWFHLGGKRLPLSFATMVPLVWIARRMGVRGTLVALIILAIFAEWFTAHGRGPMAREDQRLSFLLLLGYLWVVGITNLTVACGEEARQYSQRALRDLNEKLEQRVTERTAELRRMNGLLTSEMEERQRLEKEILGISEREQRRLGQDLHEGVSQQLAGVSFLCKVLADRLSAEKHSEASAAEELSNLFQEALDATRALARSFYPVEIESGGLQTALQGLAERTQGLFGIECELKCMGGAPSERVEDSAIHIYRIVQEALTNVIKHSQAHRVVIECSASKGREMVRVIDNGVGFGTVPQGNGMGLHLMRYRARLIGAELEVSRQNGRGTVVSCSLQPTAKER